ncbi:MAG: hypothetical protein IT233_00135 [Bacteroidia bacterium]|nr:hypothetical protein [Bacteroidia bacterium]
MGSYDILIRKLDEFIRKYYKNRLLKGGIYASAYILVFYLAAALLEYFGNFGVAIRTALFWLLLVGVGSILYVYVAVPLLQLRRVGKVLSYEEAAAIIGKHFYEVSDKLLNVLQLKNSHLGIPGSQELIHASVDQKIGQLRPVPFAAAIDLSQNRKYLKYALVPFSILLLLLILSPAMLLDPTRRIVEHRTYFEAQAPFQFTIQNSKLRTVQQEDFLLQIKLSGDEIPENVFIEIGGNEFKLQKENIIKFSYLFRNVQSDVPFRLVADGFRSKEYTLETLPNPQLVDFRVKLEYPKYLGRKEEILENTGDLLVPYGTRITWELNSKNSSTLGFRFNDSLFVLHPVTANAFRYTFIPAQSTGYSVRAGNEFLQSADSVTYSINVIPDQYPLIEVDEQKDSVSAKRMYFNGGVKDDHGFTRLTFCFRKMGAGDEKQTPLQQVNIPVSARLTQDQFYHFWDLSSFDLQPGDQFEYYFEITDNDGVNGPKSSRTMKQFYKVPTLQELSDHTDKKNEEIKDDLEKGIKDAKDIKKEIDALTKKLLDKKNVTWEEKKKLEDLIRKQEDLQKQVEDIKKQNQQNNEQKSEFSKMDENLLQKQMELEKLFESLMNEELKEKMKELQKLMDQMDKSEMQKQLEQMKLDNKDMEKELDRALEMFKQLQFEEKMQDNIKRLEELSKKQDDLSKESENKNADSKELEQKQEQLNKEFEELRKDMDELEQLNKDLERPNEIPDTEKQEQDIQQNQKNSSQQLQQNQKKNASKSQKKAGQQMKEMADAMSMSMQSSEMEQQEEDMNNLRQLLSNLIQLSFDQESLMKQFGKTKTTDPNYVKLAAQQKKLKDDAKIIEDSLLALSKRVFQLQSIVNKEISNINNNMEKSIEDFAERMTSSGMMRQQYVMTSLNNLALLLSEALNQMQQQMQNQMPGSGSCNKPGGKGKKPSMSQMRQMQESINKQIENLKKMMEQGGKTPGPKPGTGTGSGSGMNEQIVKLAAQQEMLRKMMQDMMKEGGNTPGDMKNTLKKMEETETDLVNKMLTQETMKRQQEILDKLLNYEKAEKQKETEEKRQSEQPKNEENRNLSGFLEYKKLKQKEAELLKTVPPSLAPFYKEKVTEYFNKFD